MECINCSADIPTQAKFCPECGSRVEKQDSQICANCGERLKPGAKFCQNCGTPVKAGFEEAEVRKVKTSQKPMERASARSWLASIGPFLFIPIFAGIVVILFWKNRESPPLSNASNPQQNAQSMAAMEEVRKTMTRLENNLQADPNDTASMDSLAQMYYIAGSYEKASKYLKMHLAVEPNNRDVKMFLATTYGNMNKTEEAITLIQEILKKEPTYAFGLYNLGVIYASMGNTEEAIKNWKKVVQHHPGTEIAHAAEQHIQALEQSGQAVSN